MSKVLDRIITVGLLVMVVFTALAFGTVEPWSIAIFELGVTVLLLMWAVKAVLDKRLKINVPAVALPLILFVALGLIECISFTASDGSRSALSMDVDATRSTVIVLIILLASFIIAANFFASRERLGTLASFLIIFGVALSLFALLQYFTSHGRLYGFKPMRNNPGFGPFVNPNHFAGYMEMLIPVPISLIVARAVHKQSWVFYGFASAIMGLAVVTSLSRGGMLSLMAGLVFIVVASSQLRRNRERKSLDRSHTASILKRSAAVAAVAATIFVGVVWIGAEDVIRRTAETVEQARSTDEVYSSRKWIWNDTLKLVRAYPILGVGIGAYETVFPTFASGGESKIRVDFAHNDYLQVLADAGIVGGLLAVWFIYLVARAVLSGLRSADPLRAAMAMASGAGIFSILVHSLFDFNLQIPSNSLLFLLLSAVASYAGASADRESGQPALKQTVSSDTSPLATGVSL
ncbi:MAG TPA: O-antigen ligase family protein [Blastocatellia bacterium]|nr:O-antigen ligase family protein [Blastocatellia bacterium]